MSRKVAEADSLRGMAETFFEWMRFTNYSDSTVKNRRVYQNSGPRTSGTPHFFASRSRFLVRGGSGKFGHQIVEGRAGGYVWLVSSQIHS